MGRIKITVELVVASKVGYMKEDKREVIRRIMRKDVVGCVKSVA